MTDGFEVSIDPKDLAEFHIAMENLDPEKVLKEEWRSLLVPLKRELRTYPAEIPGQKYKRTGNLKRNWQYAVLSAKSAEVSNMASYAGWVQGVGQAEVHQGRWSIMMEVGERHLQEWIEKLSAKIGRIWTR